MKTSTPMNNYHISEDAKKVLLIDHRPILRKGFDLVLKQSGHNFLIYEDRAIHPSSPFALQEKPDLIIAGVDGMSKHAVHEFLRRTRLRYAAAKIILYTCELEVVVDAGLFQRGVNAFMSGNFSLDDFQQCVDNVLAGQVFIIARSINVAIPEEPNSPKPVLSPRQTVVAGYLATGMSTSDIAKVLHKKISTISSTKANIFKKMNINSVIELARIMQQDNQRQLAY